MGPAGDRDVVPVSVVVPTIGRADLLEGCLASIARCSPRAMEVLVVDQGGGAVNDVVGRHAPLGMRLLRCDGRGIARGTNQGLREAVSTHVLVTHDDCTVPPEWVAVAARHARATPDAIVTGRVLPGGDPAAVPSTKTDSVAYDFTGSPSYGVLYPANMVVPRAGVLAIGGFDERPSLQVAAEDNDLCYRWLTSGRPMRFEPELVVTHHDWRSPDQLERLYVAYGRGQGAFYAKHLVAGDGRIPRLIAQDLGRGLRSLAGAVRHRTPRWADERRGLLRGIPAGLVAGFRDEWRIRSTRRRAPARER
jgi:GT2 family glycosyltransferase